MAGGSNPSTFQARRSAISGPDFVEVIGRYSNPRGLEKTLETLQSLLGRATRSPSARAEPIQAKVRSVVRRLGQERVDELVADYEQGRTTTELTGVYGLSKASVIQLLERNGITLRRQPPTREQVTRSVELYEAGHSLAAIERIVQVPRESIRRALIDAGVTMRPRGGRRSRVTRVTTPV